MSAPHDGLFRDAVAVAPATLLGWLADVVGSGEWPEVSVHLSGGQTIDGVPIRTGADHGQNVVVLADKRTGQLGYALLAQVAAVEVHAPQRVRDLVTGGRLAPPVAGDEPLTKLALRRQLAASPDMSIAVDWDALPDSGEALANLDRLLHGLRQIVDGVRADEMGRAAWADVDTVWVAHRASAPPSVRPVPDGLSVEADLVAALPRDLVGELRRQVNAVL